VPGLSIRGVADGRMDGSERRIPVADVYARPWFLNLAERLLRRQRWAANY
jgi:hypothetical protein